jgi:hypothetical protein
MVRRLVLLLNAAALAAVLSSPVRAADRIDMAALVDAFHQIALQGQGRVSKWTPGSTPLSLKVTAAFGAAEL